MSHEPVEGGAQDADQRSPADEEGSMNVAELRDFAQELAGEAAQMLRAHARAGLAAGLTVIEKAPGDWASELDGAVEQRLRERVLQRFAHHAFWGEESHDRAMPAAGPAGPAGTNVHAAGSIAGIDVPVWVVDPIDGSMNFLRGYPQYAISVAVLHRGEPVAGCILDPVRGELFSAARGMGAHCNGRLLQVGRVDDLARALGATVFPKPKAPFMSHYLRELEGVLRHTAGLRRAGSMALELAYLAAGRVDVFWERGMGAWDAAAGVLLIREAGGAVWSLDERPWWDSQALAASAPKVQSAWDALLRRLEMPE